MFVVKSVVELVASVFSKTATVPAVVRNALEIVILLAIAKVATRVVNARMAHVSNASVGMWVAKFRGL